MGYGKISVGGYINTFLYSRNYTLRIMKLEHLICKHQKLIEPIQVLENTWAIRQVSFIQIHMNNRSHLMIGGQINHNSWARKYMKSTGESMAQGAEKRQLGQVLPDPSLHFSIQFWWNNKSWNCYSLCVKFLKIPRIPWCMLHERCGHTPKKCSCRLPWNSPDK